MKNLDFAFYHTTASIIHQYNHIQKVFNDGIEEEEVERKLKAIGIENNTLLSIYSIFDGNYPNPYFKLEYSSHGYLLSLDYAIDEYLTDYIFKQYNMFPIISSLRGDFVCLELAPKKVQSLLLFSPEGLILKPKRIYDDFTKFCRTIMKCYETGAYKIVNNELEVDVSKEFEISRNINLRSKYWKT